MRGLISTLACLCALALTTPSYAEAAVQIARHNAWGTYSYNADSGKVCYVLTVPTLKEPTNLDHGDIYFFVSQKPGKAGSFEPQFITSYDMKKDSKVSVIVGNQTFSMFTRGKSAWLEDASQEPKLVAAMKGGMDMTVKAVSGRGNDTKYTFSLRGITAALDSINQCK